MLSRTAVEKILFIAALGVTSASCPRFAVLYFLAELIPFLICSTREYHVHAMKKSVLYQPCRYVADAFCGNGKALLYREGEHVNQLCVPNRERSHREVRDVGFPGYP